ncbi:MAG TPA: NAD(+)/NADH kinase [Gemmatimonadales bacterium]|jgi:NAD+ kinase
MNVGVVGNPSYDDLRSLLERLAAAAPRLGFTLFSEERLLDYWPEPRPAVFGAGTSLDCLLTFGGDGTLLRGARLLDGAPTPVIGINVGRVGFLTTAASRNLDWVLDATARQAYTIEPRLALAATVEGGQGGKRPQPIALNDVVVHKGGVARVLRFRVSVDGDEVGAYSADGIIVATPTGSTAYSLSAGGPIVVPGVDAIAVTAICPHTLAVRPLVLPSSAVLLIEPIPPWSDTEEIVLSLDGQVSQTIHSGERLIIRRAERPVLLGRMGPEGFFARMRRKLNWGDLSDRERK